jgi:hypothetical protein
MKCPTCGHVNGEKLPPLRPMGMLPYLMNRKEKDLLLKMAKDVNRAWRQGELGLRQMHFQDSMLRECGLVINPIPAVYRLTPKGVVAALRVAEWDAQSQETEIEFSRSKGLRKRSALADAVLANAGVPKWELSHAAD